MTHSCKGAQGQTSTERLVVRALIVVSLKSTGLIYAGYVRAEGGNVLRMNGTSEVAKQDCEPTFLVSSSLEATWPNNERIIFLGEWCLRYSRRDIWSGLDYAVAPYHWDDRAQIPKDLEYISDVYEMLLPKLAQVLNGAHGVDYSLRYWRVVVGWWLFYFAQIFFDRWQVIQAADRAYSNSRMLRIPPFHAIPASNDMSEFLEAMALQSWNERLSADIAERWTGIQVDLVPEPLIRMEYDMVSVPLSRLETTVHGRIRASVKKLLHWFGLRQPFSGCGISLHSDYLRPLAKLRLCLMLRQFFSVNLSVQPPRFFPSFERREWKLPTSECDMFTRALAEFVPLYLPACYLEGYADISKIAESSGSSHAPRAIMTANAFSSDDHWKLWAALHVEEGSKLVIAQHGGHYGVGAWSATQQHEIAISDRYLSWGWANERQPKVNPAPATKLIGVKRKRPRNNGYCLQVTSSFPPQSHWLYSAPIGPQVASYLNDQLIFASSLSTEVRSSLIVRTYPQDYGWDITERWRDSDPSVQIDPGHISIKSLLDNTKLYVATYNATTFLESFTQGIPTVMFWNPKFWELSEDAMPFFEELRLASVLFDDPISCARHVNNIWGDVPGWWMSEIVQLAVRNFSNQYAYVGMKPLRELKAALTKW